MDRNGVAVKVSATLGKTLAGRDWVELPIDVDGELLKFIESKLCLRVDASKLSSPPIEVNSPTWEGVLEAFAEHQKRLAASKAIRDAEEAEEAERMAKFAALDDEEFFQQTEHTRGLTRELQDRRFEIVERKRLARIASKAAELDALPDDRFVYEVRQGYRAVQEVLTSDDHGQRMEERRKRIESEQKATQEAKKERERVELEELLRRGPPDLFERHESGYLSPKELESYLAKIAFASVPLDLYERISRDELEHSDQCYEQDVRCAVRGYGASDDYLTAEQWDAWKRAQGHLANFDHELRQVTISCHGCSAEPIERLQVLATTRIAGVVVRRTYALK